ncbi:DNA topoisomerase I, partial [bacterium]
MAKNLVIVESPTKCRTLRRYLGKDFTVVASVGHIVDLPRKELAVNVKNNFKPKYVIIPGKKKFIDEIKQLARGADNIFLASDPDREGEAIAWHISRFIDSKGKNIYRVLFNEITKRAVLAGISHPTTLDIHKVNAQQARRILDRLVGYEVSPLLWKAIYGG